MTLDGWTVAIIVCKLITYIGLSAATGGTLLTVVIHSFAERAEVTDRLTRPVLMSIAIGFLACCLGFLLQVGMLADAGLIGMFNLNMASLLASTPVGAATTDRLLGSAILTIDFLATSHFIKVHQTNQTIKVTFAIFWLLGAYVTGFSASLSGHTAETSGVIRLAVSLHSLIAVSWIGALLPLWMSCRLLALPELQKLMLTFGRVATGWVMVLGLAGLAITYQLVGSFASMLNTSYGLLLCLKLLFVAGILLIAARHKWQLAPKLTNELMARKLEHSITLEGCIALSILLITAVLSTALGPEVGY